MAGFLFGLLAALITGVGARDQALIAGLSERQGARPAVLLIGLVCAVLSSAAAGWAGQISAPLLVPAARTWLVAMATGLAALEMLFLRPARKPAEPTNSLGAFAAVLLAQQLTDAARLLIFALAAASSVPPLAALGGGIGSAVTLITGWSAGAALGAWRLGRARRWLGGALLLVTIWLTLGLMT